MFKIGDRVKYNAIPEVLELDRFGTIVDIIRLDNSEALYSLKFDDHVDICHVFETNLVKIKNPVPHGWLSYK